MWVNEWVNMWVTELEWVSEWPSECVSEWVCGSLRGLLFLLGSSNITALHSTTLMSTALRSVINHFAILNRKTISICRHCPLDAVMSHSTGSGLDVYNGQYNTILQWTILLYILHLVCTHCQCRMEAQREDAGSYHSRWPTLDTLLYWAILYCNECLMRQCGGKTS